MIDIKLVRETPNVVRASQKARGEDPAIVDAILAADEAARRSSLGELERVRALETHQQPGGSVVVPEALRPYLGLDVLTPLT